MDKVIGEDFRESVNEESKLNHNNMTINLEKALIKANKKFFTPAELLVIKEYERHGDFVDDDALLRVGLNTNIKGGQLLTGRQQKAKDETLKFKQERVFHISQIEQTCKDYHLRFLPSNKFQGTIDKELVFKINNFEAAYNVKCQCDEKPWRPSELIVYIDPATGHTSVRDLYEEKNPKIQNTFIMAPASSFKLEQRPKDPLFFYKINEEYYYLIHKWGNNLSIFRRVLGWLSNSFNFWLAVITPNVFAILITILGGVDSKIDVWLIAINTAVLTTNTIFYLINMSDYSPIKNKWNSQYIN